MLEHNAYVEKEKKKAYTNLNMDNKFDVKKAYNNKKGEHFSYISILYKKVNILLLT